MPIFHSKHKYQLIHPVVGTKAYYTTTLMKGAKQCFEELKTLNINATQFSVLDHETYEVYKFEIDNPLTLKKTEHGNNVMHDICNQLSILQLKVDNIEKYLSIPHDGSYKDTSIVNHTVNPNVNTFTNQVINPNIGHDTNTILSIPNANPNATNANTSLIDVTQYGQELLGQYLEQKTGIQNNLLNTHCLNIPHIPTIIPDDKIPANINKTNDDCTIM